MNASHESVVLLVEDNADDAMLFRRAFGIVNPRARLEIVTNALEAQVYLMSQDAACLPLPSLVLLDLNLPGRSGMELLGWIRSRKALRPMVVVALTGSREPGDVRLAYDIGLNSFLVKPMGFDALLDMVKMISGYWIEQNEHSTPSWNGPQPIEEHEEHI